MSNLARWIIGGLIGLVVATVAGYVVVNWDTIKKHFFNKEPASVIEKTIKLKVKEASKNAVKIDALDECNDPIADFEVSGDEVDSSLEVGDTITI
jgi:hypothetical protein